MEVGFANLDFVKDNSIKILSTELKGNYFFQMSDLHH